MSHHVACRDKADESAQELIKKGVLCSPALRETLVFRSFYDVIEDIIPAGGSLRDLMKRNISLPTTASHRIRGARLPRSPP
jgi:hypothetical protein